jgi:hypothetical protein
MVKSAAIQSNATATARPERLFWRRADTLQHYRGSVVVDKQFATTETKLSSHRAALTCAGPMVAPFCCGR